MFSFPVYCFVLICFKFFCCCWFELEICDINSSLTRSNPDSGTNKSKVKVNLILFQYNFLFYFTDLVCPFQTNCFITGILSEIFFSKKMAKYFSSSKCATQHPVLLFNSTYLYSLKRDYIMALESLSLVISYI